jgi:hypothetical protein
MENLGLTYKRERLHIQAGLFELRCLRTLLRCTHRLISKVFLQTYKTVLYFESKPTFFFYGTL